MILCNTTLMTPAGMNQTAKNETRIGLNQLFTLATVPETVSVTATWFPFSLFHGPEKGASFSVFSTNGSVFTNGFVSGNTKEKQAFEMDKLVTQN